MLPPQPLVPPPPPPQLQESMYETSDIHDKRASVIPQYSSQSSITNGMNTMNIYADNYHATYSQSSQFHNNDTTQSAPANYPANQTSQIQQSNPSQTHQFQHSLTAQRLSTSSLESASSAPLMPMNVKGMLLNGLPSDEVLRNWLSSIKCEEYIENFIYHGYDMHLVTRMTPQDLAAVGCKSPALRKKLLAEIKKLNLEYEIPDCESSLSLEKWLESLKLSQYHAILIREGYETMDKVRKLTWEDLEEIGIVKLGHQKRLLLGIDKIEKAAKQLEESQNDNAIYDVHPNHRVSLNGGGLEHRVGTIGRVRSGLFQTRSGANLDHRGLPVATVMPALKHVNGSIMKAESNQPQYVAHTSNGAKSNGIQIITSINKEQIQDTRPRMETLKLSDLPSTIRRNPPPLPPMRTNSLKISQGNGMTTQPIYGGNSGVHEGSIYGVQPTNSTSFLRTPKLGTLTATTNKMLASGGHIQTIPTNSNNAKIVPIREAPLPPIQQVHLPTYQPNLIQTTIPEKIDEELSVGLLNQNNFPLPPQNCDVSNPSFINVTGNQLENEFPPPPPCEP